MHGWMKCIIKQLCAVMNIQYSCVVATSFVHTADTWGLNLEASKKTNFIVDPSHGVAHPQ